MYSVTFFFCRLTLGTFSRLVKTGSMKGVPLALLSLESQQRSTTVITSVAVFTLAATVAVCL